MRSSVVDFLRFLLAYVDLKLCTPIMKMGYKTMYTIQIVCLHNQFSEVKAVYAIQIVCLHNIPPVLQFEAPVVYTIQIV